MDRYGTSANHAAMALAARDVLWHFYMFIEHDCGKIQEKMLNQSSE
jgi:hypothetical protein